MPQQQQAQLWRNVRFSSIQNRCGCWSKLPVFEAKRDSRTRPGIPRKVARELGAEKQLQQLWHLISHSRCSWASVSRRNSCSHQKPQTSSKSWRMPEQIWKSRSKFKVQYRHFSKRRSWISFPNWKARSSSSKMTKRLKLIKNNHQRKLLWWLLKLQHPLLMVNSLAHGPRPPNIKDARGIPRPRAPTSWSTALLNSPITWPICTRTISTIANFKIVCKMP